MNLCHRRYEHPLVTRLRRRPLRPESWVVRGHAVLDFPVVIDNCYFYLKPGSTITIDSNHTSWICNNSFQGEGYVRVK